MVCLWVGRECVETVRDNIGNAFLGGGVKNTNEIKPVHGANMSLISISDLGDMHEPSGYPWRFLYRPIPRDVLRYPFSCVFDPKMPRLLLLLFLAAKAEVSPVGLQARIEQIRCGDNGHEALRFPSGLVYLWKTRTRQVLDYRPPVEESKPLSHQIPPFSGPGSTVPPGQAQDTWGIRRT